ncbi:anthranilate synthase component I family protein [Olivibacter sitiensis]|uniref:anthranilate synthase component I family protein n=1 Tax=Olivibacter sitiensis TaxID=376470 RepID=UPI00040C2C1B|nr:anthranilate synthase component I family protein [Olivibacter sitiensis]
MYEVVFDHKDALELYTKKALQWASLFDQFCYLNGNQLDDRYGKYHAILAVGAKSQFVWGKQGNSDTFSQLQAFLDTKKGDWKFGFLTYDLKNKIEKLHSPKTPSIVFPLSYFFVPQHLLLIDKDDLRVEIQSDEPNDILHQIREQEIQHAAFVFKGEIHPKTSREKYVEIFENLKRHILRGDIYEVNLCQEFVGEQTSIDPLQAYWTLNSISPAPFSSMFKHNQKYVLCTSPERFLARRGKQLISQPIKGTAKRGNDEQEDDHIKNTLLHDPKERSENIMIVDLVRHDLTKSAEAGTVRVLELAGLHSFKTVHQLISTVACEVRNNINETNIIANTFPPGSMTGAPKISAMQLIDRYEESARGIYSGSIGYFSPDGDFDFNVVIRSLIYDANQGLISFHVGGAITALADAEKEYEECLTKAAGILQLLELH